MNLAELLKPDSVICETEIKSKKRALEILAEKLSQALPPETDDAELKLFQLLIEREKLGSTGLGHGIALPHARTELAKHATAAFLKLEKGINFDSPDKQPTDLIFALMVPEHSPEKHLQILAGLAAMFSDKVFCQSLRDAKNGEQIYQVLTHWQAPAQQAS